jgi:hypothetical protein
MTTTQQRHLTAEAATDTVDAARVSLFAGAYDLFMGVEIGDVPIKHLAEGNLVNLLTAYVSMRDESDPLLKFVRHVISEIACRNPVGTYTALAELVATSSLSHAGITSALRAALPTGLLGLRSSDVPGRFTRDAYNVVFDFAHRIDEAWFMPYQIYLKEQLGAQFLHGTVLSEDLAFALTLVEEWAGTYEDLVGTACELQRRTQEQVSERAVA